MRCEVPRVTRALIAPCSRFPIQNYCQFCCHLFSNLSCSTRVSPFFSRDHFNDRQAWSRQGDHGMITSFFTTRASIHELQKGVCLGEYNHAASPRVDVSVCPVWLSVAIRTVRTGSQGVPSRTQQQRAIGGVHVASRKQNCVNHRPYPDTPKREEFHYSRGNVPEVSTAKCTDAWCVWVGGRCCYNKG